MHTELFAEERVRASSAKHLLTHIPSSVIGGIIFFRGLLCTTDWHYRRKEV